MLAWDERRCWTQRNDTVFPSMEGTMVAKPHAAPHDSSVLLGEDRSVRVDKGLRGRGAMRDVPLDIDPRIDLTQPIYEQVLALEKAGKEAVGQD